MQKSALIKHNTQFQRRIRQFYQNGLFSSIISEPVQFSSNNLQLGCYLSIATVRGSDYGIGIIDCSSAEVVSISVLERDLKEK